MSNLSLMTKIKLQLCMKTVHSGFLPFAPLWQHHFLLLHFGEYI